MCLHIFHSMSHWYLYGTKNIRRQLVLLYATMKNIRRQLVLLYATMVMPKVRLLTHA